MTEPTLILMIIVLLILVVVLAIAVVYLCKILFRVEEKISDIELTLHFATDHYLINERKKQERGLNIVD